MKKKLKVAIQGIATSFHEVAAYSYFNTPIQTIECLSFQSVCESLDSGKADYAVMAIENTIAGSILQNYFLLQKFHFSIVGELYLPIHMHLLAINGASLKKLHSIESHPMAIRQCSEFLNKLNGVRLIETEDTALSAKKLSEGQNPFQAAIGNEQTANRFGLKILKKHIETNKKNFTRFLVLRKKKYKGKDRNKASICFEVKNEVGSLAVALMIFKDHQINLSKIQSIPVIGKPREYSIHVDVEWENPDKFQTAMKEIAKNVLNLVILGEYLKAPIKFN